MEQGVIIKGISGFYYVKCGTNVVTCTARGVFRNLGVTPIVGDYVTFERHASGNAQINAVLPRRNTLVRPYVANIDILGIVVSASVPEPDWMLIDKLLISAQCASIRPVLILNKIDAASTATKQFMADYFGFTCLNVSAQTGQGMEELKDLIGSNIFCLAGQSAVGKTSILNSLLPNADFAIGELSRKTERGKHTTRVAQLIPFGDGAILDTPGFSFFDTKYLTTEQLDACYPEFLQAQGCRYSGCRHISEPDCGVKELLTCGKMSTARYQRYVIISKENEMRRKHRYD